MPDFDIDFCQDRPRRGDPLRAATNTARDRVAQIITFGKLQARAVLRDVGRVLEMPYGQVDRICKLVPNNPAASGHPAAGDRRRAAAAGRCATSDEDGRAADGDRAAARGPVPPRLDPCRGRGDRRPAADRAGAALPRSALGHAGHAVQHEIRRARGAGEVRLPRPEDADRPGARRRPAARRAAIALDLDQLPLDDAKTYELLAARRHGRRVPARRPGHARHAAQAAARPVRGHHRGRWRSTARARWRTSRATSRCKHGEEEPTTCIPRLRAESWTRPTASWSTRNR